MERVAEQAVLRGPATGMLIPGEHLLLARQAVLMKSNPYRICYSGPRTAVQQLAGRCAGSRGGCTDWRQRKPCQGPLGACVLHLHAPPGQ